MTTLLLIRHGQTDWNMAGRWQGHSDIPLNALGRQQAEAIARRLAKWPLAAVYSSDLQRAQQTAVPIATQHGLEPQADAGLRERGLGSLEGLTRTEIVERFPHTIQASGYIEAEDSETQDALLARLLPTYQDIITRHPAETVALVSHGGILRLLLKHILGIPLTHYPSFALHNVSLSRIEVEASGVHRLTLLNDTYHLHAI